MSLYEKEKGKTNHDPHLWVHQAWIIDSPTTVEWWCTREQKKYKVLGENMEKAERGLTATSGPVA